MPGNSFGQILRLTTFGESHGPGIGGILEGCPAGLPLDVRDLQAELDLRKASNHAASTSRREPDKVEILSGVTAGKTSGTPIAFYIENQVHNSDDYAHLAGKFRPGHADFTYFKKYSGNNDWAGGGRASGRETAIRVAAGAIAKKLLLTQGISLAAACIEFGGIAIPEAEINLANAIERPWFAASDAIIPLWEERLEEALKNQDTLGGIVQVSAYAVPPGLGEPVFDRLDARLAYALMSIGAVKGVEIGSGFQSARMTGSQNNDQILPKNATEDLSQAPKDLAKSLQVDFASNHAGGILGGISSGQEIVVKAAIKPIASIPRLQNTVDLYGKATSIKVAGRHDRSAIPRVVPVCASMVALTLADFLLLQQRMNIL